MNSTAVLKEIRSISLRSLVLVSDLGGGSDYNVQPNGIEVDRIAETIFIPYLSIQNTLLLWFLA